jgi:biotin-dependent carboxylase-like uncharacterized protein
MTPSIRILRAGPLATLQDSGRPGLLRYGISASGPMDRSGFERAGDWIGGAGATGIEFTSAGLSFIVEGGPLGAAFDGGAFRLAIDAAPKEWPARAVLQAGTVVDITPGAAGNYGYARFDREVDIPQVMGSHATSSIARLGGWQGRALAPGDIIPFGAAAPRRVSRHPSPTEPGSGPIRVVWGLHADVFGGEACERFAAQPFQVSPQIDRMGVRLRDTSGVFAEARVLSLASDAVVPGDIQILGDGTPIVLMRDHQPTGGYPRIATVISADFDRFAQLRPGSEVRFQPVTLAHAQEAKP